MRCVGIAGGNEAVDVRSGRIRKNLLRAGGGSCCLKLWFSKPIIITVLTCCKTDVARAAMIPNTLENKITAMKNFLTLDSIMDLMKINRGETYAMYKKSLGKFLERRAGFISPDSRL
jgi:hypothetical protein